MTDCGTMKRFLPLLLLVAACSASATTTTVATTVPTPTVPTVTSTAAPASTTTTTEAPEPVLADGVEGLDLAKEVFDASRVERFRARTEIVSSSDAEESAILLASYIDGAYERTPAGVQLAVQTAGAGSGNVDVEIIAVGDDAWVRTAEGDWEQDRTALQLLALANVSLLSPASLEIILPVLDEVGEEEVAGRPAVHLQGGVDELQAFLSANGVRDLNAFNELTEGSIDLWLDRAGFVSKAEYRFGGVIASTLATEYYRASFELSDFDGDFNITPP